MKNKREDDKDDYQVSGIYRWLDCRAMNKIWKEIEHKSMTQKRDLSKSENFKIVLKTRAVDKIT